MIFPCFYLYLHAMILRQILIFHTSVKLNNIKICPRKSYKVIIIILNLSLFKKQTPILG